MLWVSIFSYVELQSWSKSNLRSLSGLSIYIRNSDQMCRGSKWEEKIQKCFLQKVELKTDIEGYKIESGMLSLLGSGMEGQGEGSVCSHK